MNERASDKIEAHTKKGMDQKKGNIKKQQHTNGNKQTEQTNKQTQATQNEIKKKNEK